MYMYENGVFLARSRRIDRRNKITRLFRWIRFITILLFIVALSTWGVHTFFFQQKDIPQTTIAKGLVTPLEGSTPLRPPEFAVLGKSTELERVVSEALSGTSGNYGVVIKNLTTNEGYMRNERKVYWSGSLYKLWVMGVVYDQLKQQKLKDDQILREKIAVLNDKFHIASEAAERKDGEIELSVSDALFKMITISDNYAALLLTAHVRLAQVSIFLKNNHFFESKVGTAHSLPLTTPADTALFFEKLYKGEIIDKETSDKMLTLLKSQRLNDKIPKYLPDDIKVAHKTGELGEFSHDAGIIYSPAGDYIFVVLSESIDPIAAEERIARVSEAVYNYFITTSE